MELHSLQLQPPSTTLLLLLLLPLSLVIFLFFYRNPAKNPTSTGLKPYPLLGHLPQFLKNRHRFLAWITEILARSPTHTMGFQVPGQVTMVITANPTNLEHMLRRNFDNYVKGDQMISMLEDLLGHGIFNSDGEHWRWQRKAASFQFNTRSLRSFVVGTVQHEIAARLLPLLRSAAEKGTTLDLQDVLERFGFDNICKVAFGEDPACLDEEGAGKAAAMEFTEAFGDAQNLIAGRFMDALNCTWRVKKLLNIGSERRLKELVSVIHNFSMEIIRSRRERSSSSEQRDDLLSRFASNKDYTDEFLRDVVTSFILAGRETTSSALTWFFWLLSSEPDLEKKILEEVRSVRAVSPTPGETFSFDELREMHYLHAALSETLRLYPPVPFDRLSCREDDVLPDGTFVGRGWCVSYSAYAMGRMEDIWGDDCRDYRPERWLENGCFRPESPFRFPVFHAGPRTCLGKEMAYIQMKSIAACVLERFEIEVVGKDKTPEHLFSLTLKMKGGLEIRVRERERVDVINGGKKI